MALKPWKAAPEAEAARRQAFALVGVQYKNWDVVWARMVGFPWWPAVVFHSWDAVEAAGLPLPRERPALAPPEKREVAVPNTKGQLEQRVVTDRFCLVMFLDKGDWCAVNMSTQVMPFTLGFRVNSRPSHKKAKTSGFRLAVQRAIRLLHTSHECSEDDLAMLNAPPREKRQRVEPATKKRASNRRAADVDWDDAGENSANDNNDDDVDSEVVEHAPPAKLKAKAPLPPKKNKQTKAPRKLVADGEMHAPTKRTQVKQARKSVNKIQEGGKSASVKKKASVRKKKAAIESSSSGDNNEEEEDDSDDSVENDDGDVEYIEQSATQKAEGDNSMEDSASPPADTPLSHIWTEHAEDSAAASGGSGATTKTLVYKQDFVWDDSLFTTNDEVVAMKKDSLEEHSSPARDRPLGKRQMRSVQQSHIRQNLMMGNLDPHTMVQCEAYRSKDEIENPMHRSRGSSNLEPPFQVQVHPDAAFVCDLHAHLATCEIIGFLGGRWDEASKTLYIQAAFPCRSLMIDGDDGSTDVEMDPGSEIELREIIQNAELEVVGWYHSHPAFAPDPSIRDIENQTSYQQLFQRRTQRQHADEQKPSIEISEPFVGLIVGTYDTKRDSPVSLFRYFHTRGEKVSGGAKREIYMPYELIPTRRHYRAVLSDERRAEIATLTMYPSVFEALFGKQSGAMRLRGAEVPIDHLQVDFAGIQPVMAPLSKKDDDAASAATKPRKRKSSAELPVKDVNDAKKAKGRRGRLPRAANLVSEELLSKKDGSVGVGAVEASTGAAGNKREPIVVDADEVNVVSVDGSIVASAIEPIVVDASESADADARKLIAVETRESADLDPSVNSSNIEQNRATVDAVVPVAAADDGGVATIAGDEKEPIVVDADDSIAAVQLPRKPADMVVVVDLSSLPPSSSADPRGEIDRLVDLSEANSKPESPEGSGSSQASSTASASGVLDGVVGITGGRRRGRKPVQTQRKVTTFTSQSTKADDPSLVTHTAMASQFAVYGAFGTISSADTGAPLPDRKDALIQSSVHVSLQTSVKGDLHSDLQQSEVKSPRPMKEEAVLDGAVLAPSEGKLVSRSTIAEGADATKVDSSNAATTPDAVAESPVIKPETTAVDVLETVEVEIAASVADACGKPAPEAEAMVAETFTATNEEVGAVESIAPVSLLEMDGQVEDVFVTKEIGDSQEAQGCTEDAVGNAVLGIVSRIETEAKEATGCAEAVPMPASASDATVQSPGVKVEISKTAAPTTEVPQPVKKIAGVEDVMVVEKQPPVKEESAVVEDAVVEVTSASADVMMTESSHPVKDKPQQSPVKKENSAVEDSVAVARVAPEGEDVVMAETQQPVKVESIAAKYAVGLELPSVAPPVAAPQSAKEAATAGDDVGVGVDAAASEDVTMTELAEPVKQQVGAVDVAAPRVLLFGKDRQVEDIRTSLAGIESMVARMKEEQRNAVASDAAKRPVIDVAEDANVAGDMTVTSSANAEGGEMTPSAAVDGSRAGDHELSAAARQEAHLLSLRTKYGAGISGCAEQVITLVDYYCKFERRIDLNETWKARVSKLNKIEASMAEYVRYVNVPVHLRQEFVQDVAAYLELSWRLARPAR